jgi:hypothetical protein
MKCPRCSCDITVEAMKPGKQSMGFTINHEGDFMQAKTIGGILTKLDTLLIDRAGEPAQVLLQSVEIQPRLIKIWLLVSPEKAE